MLFVWIELYNSSNDYYQYFCSNYTWFNICRQQERVASDREEIERQRKVLTKRKPGGAGPKSIKPDFIKPGQERRYEQLINDVHFSNEINVKLTWRKCKVSYFHHMVYIVCALIQKFYTETTGFKFSQTWRQSILVYIVKKLFLMYCCPTLR